MAALRVTPRTRRAAVQQSAVLSVAGTVAVVFAKLAFHAPLLPEYHARRLDPGKVRLRSRSVWTDSSA